jgi:general secretion pathway protein K
MKKDLRDNRGVAIIIAVAIIGIIVILTLQFNKSMMSELYAAATLNDGIKLEYVASSGFNCALAVIREDDKETDTLHDTWADFGYYSVYSAELFEEGLFSVEISDLAGKIQINNLVGLDGNYNTDQKGLLIRLLTSEEFNMDTDEAEDITDAIKDWIDKDDEVTRFGAEDPYYQSLDPPYTCRNHPLESLDDLLLIKGITWELYYGVDGGPGINDYVTVHGEGRININTADPVILKILSDDMDQQMVEEIIAYRQDEDNDLNSPNWYKNALGTNEDIIHNGLITTRTDFFEITSIAFKDSITRGIKGEILRDGATIRVLSWKSL